MELRSYLRWKAAIGILGSAVIISAFGALFCLAGDSKSNVGVIAVAQFAAIPLLYGVNMWRLSAKAEEGIMVNLLETVEYRFLTGICVVGGALTLIVPPIVKFSLGGSDGDIVRMLSLIGVIPIGFIVFAIFTRVRNYKTRLILALCGLWCCSSAIADLVRL